MLGSGGFVLIALIIQGWQTDLAQADAESSVVLTGIYAGVNLIMFVLGLLMILVQDFRLSPGWWLLLACLLSFAITDTLYWLLLAGGTYVEGDWLDLGWLVAHLAMAGAALIGLPEFTMTPARSGAHWGSRPCRSSPSPPALCPSNRQAPRLSRYFSASSAAMQPEPAEVMAWR